MMGASGLTDLSDLTFVTCELSTTISKYYLMFLVLDKVLVTETLTMVLTTTTTNHVGSGNYIPGRLSTRPDDTGVRRILKESHQNTITSPVYTKQVHGYHARFPVLQLLTRMPRVTAN